MVLAAHQGQLDLVLDILDVKGAALTDPAGERAGDLVGKPLDDLVHPARCGGAVALDREEGLGHRHRDLAGIEFRDRAVAADHLHRKLGVRRGRRSGTGLEKGNGAGFAID